MTRKTRNAREDLLATAERLFAEQGFDAVSLRSINTEAGYSVAALHYHFRSKEVLIETLLSERQRGVMSRRGELLERLGREPTVDAHSLAEALVLPFAELILDHGEAGLRTVKLFFRAYVGQQDFGYVQKATDESLRLFDPFLQAALPFLDQQTRQQRWLLASQFTFQGLANYDMPAGTGRRNQSRKELERYVDQLVDFITGGLVFH